MYSNEEERLETLNNIINELYESIIDEEGNVINEEQRILIADKVVEDYFDKYEEYPPPAALDRIASYILKRVNFGKKWKQEEGEEYPFLSHRQYVSRISREASLVLANNYSSSNVDLSIKTRTSRIQKELKTKKVK